MWDPELSEAHNTIMWIEIATFVVAGAAVAAWATWWPRPKPQNDDQDVPF